MRSNLRGARWNPSGVEALYCSLDPATAAAEIDNLLDSQPVPITRQRLTYPLRVRLTRVADLRPHPFAAVFDYTHDLTGIDQCQTIGSAAWLGLGGVVVLSLHAGGDNLVILVANLAPDDFYEPDDAYKHPPGPPPSVAYEPVTRGRNRRAVNASASTQI